jgi:putative component of membrane protein insertase Oxa1/YidC/SpoIIIJ protein YidD
MQTTSLDRLSRYTASALITTYQKKISPKKGFSCAHRVLHRSESCSQYIKRIILEQGLIRAIPLSRQRFQACKAASQVLKTRRTGWVGMQAEDDNNEQAESDGKSKQSKNIKNDNFKNYSASNSGSSHSFCSDTSCADSNCTSCVNLTVDVVSNSADCIANIPDLSAIDCGIADCSGADCSGMDCNFGSCS